MSQARSFAKRILGKKQRVLCIGLSKTGTTTFMEACKILGYNHKSMGFEHAFVNRRMLPIYLSAARHDSFDDYPWFFLYRFFDRHFPNSKFILTTRSSTDVWHSSFVRHEARRGKSRLIRQAYGLSSPRIYKNYFCNFYESHNSKAREYFKGDSRFIEMCWETGDSWGKLCDFLEKPVPDVDFPHANRGTPGSSTS